MAKEKESSANPFFRGDEKTWDGGEKTIKSSVASVFNHGYLRKDQSNVMEDEIKSQLGGQGASRQVTGDKKGGRKK